MIIEWTNIWPSFLNSYPWREREREFILSTKRESNWRERDTSNQFFFFPFLLRDMSTAPYKVMVENLLLAL